MDAIEQAKILIVDDEPANVRLLEVILAEAEYKNAFSTTDSRKVIEQFDRIKPDLLLLDLRMPYVDGLKILRTLTPEARGSVPILVLTADDKKVSRFEALATGADDFIVKPFDNLEVRLRIRNLLRTRLASVFLSEVVEKRTAELSMAQRGALDALARAAEFRDDSTGKHTRRVGEVSAKIAGALGFSSDAMECLRVTAPLHDVGKIAIPDAILLKSGKLTESEMKIMMTHTTVGAELLSSIDCALMASAKEIALNHHERWDGAGYPNGLRGPDIPISARIVAVADVFDALINDRPYKAAWPKARAIEEVRDQSGRQFCPEVVGAFLTVASHDTAGVPDRS